MALSVQIPRLLRYGLQNFWRNSGLSIATTFVMVLTMLMIGTLVSVNLLANDAIATVEGKVDVTVYLDPVLTETQITVLQAEIEQYPEVARVSYITKEEALARFERTHRDNALISASLTELTDNPLEGALIVNAKQPESYAQISERLKKHSLASLFTRITFDDNRDVIERLEHSARWVRGGGFAVSGVFAVIALLVIYNTVRLTIFSRREEISIMKLVGATNRFIRTPFLIEGTLYGLVAAVVSFGILFPLFVSLAPRVAAFLGGATAARFSAFAHNVPALLGLLLTVGVAIGITSSAVAIKRYLKQIA